MFDNEKEAVLKVINSLWAHDAWNWGNTCAKLVNQEIDWDKPAIVEIHTSMFNRHAGVTPGWPSDPMIVSLDEGLNIKNNNCDPVYIALKNIKKKKINLIIKKSKQFIKNY